MRSARAEGPARTTLALVALALLALACAGCGRARPSATRAVEPHRSGARPSPPGRFEANGLSPAAIRASAGGQFAGYLRQGALRSLGAQWTVPRIRPNSQLGRASTWIGAAASSLGTVSSFIQVGTQEELRPGSGGFSPADPFYEAFFSDTARGYAPVPLFPVHPGDRISVGLTLVRHAWTVSIRDRDTRARLRFSTPQEAGAHFGEAQFLQEDVTDGVSGRADPYPRLTSTVMSGLRVNHRPPSYASLAAAWMALPRDFLAPTPLDHDAFRVLPRTLSAPQARFLDITARFNAENVSFSRQLEAWLRTGVRTAVLSQATDRFTAALGALVGALRAGDWPPRASGVIRREAAIFAAQIPRLRRAATQGPAAVDAVFPQGRTRARDGAINRLVDRRMDIQQTP